MRRVLKHFRAARAWRQSLGPSLGNTPHTPYLDAVSRPCDFHLAETERLSLTRSEIWRIEKYLRSLFRLDTITLLERPKQADSVEVHVAGEFIGVIFKDDEDGETTYAFQMAILEMDLPEAPPSRAG